MSFRSFAGHERSGSKYRSYRIVIPAEAGIQSFCPPPHLDTGFRRYDRRGGCVVGETKRLFQTTDHDRGALLRIFHCVAVAASAFVAAGCDPIINIGGTFFPGWVVSILIGSALTVAIRYVFVFTRLERHVGPLALIYTSLGLLLSVVSWLILYRS